MQVRILAAIAVVLCSRAAFAQGLRISTQVYDISEAAPAGGKIVSSSLSLCHNGRVYDYMDSVDEVVVFDPVERRFTILNPSRKISTVLSFDEILQLLESRRPKTDEYIRELKATGRPDDLRIAESIQFQLNPGFSETCDAMKGTLILTSRTFTYRVETRMWDDPQQVERYLNATDWTARLNFILHPSSLFPEPRLALNTALRRLHDRMPVSVELDLRPDMDLRLKAEHQLTPQLTDNDHARIARWEGLARSAEIRRISLRNYQETVVLTKSR